MKQHTPLVAFGKDRRRVHSDEMVSRVLELRKDGSSYHQMMELCGLSYYQVCVIMRTYGHHLQQDRPRYYGDEREAVERCDSSVSNFVYHWTPDRQFIMPEINVVHSDLIRPVTRERLMARR